MAPRHSRAEVPEKRLVEGSDVDDALGLVEALERGEWPAAVSEFTGVVVLDDPRA